METEVGKNPIIVAGATIYLGDRMLTKQLGKKVVLTQTLISDSTKISEYSIRDNYVNLLKPIVK